MPSRKTLATRRGWLFLVAGPLLAQPESWRGTWSATGARQPLTGAWTARRHPDGDSGSGAWTLFDRTGKTALSDSWSAGWKGRWQAVLDAALESSRYPPSTTFSPRRADS